MPEPHSRSGLFWLIAGCVLLGVVGVAYGTSPGWWPWLEDRLGRLVAGDPPAEDEAAAHTDSNVLKLSDEAKRTLNVSETVLKTQPYSEVLRIPARTIVVPGTGRLEVTAPTSGVVTSILAQAGSPVQPSQPLMELKLIHEEGVRVQLELLDALAKQEVVAAEIARLEKLEAGAPGALPGTKLLQQRYEQRHLAHTVASRRQMLILLGLGEQRVDALIDHHRKHALPGADAGEDEDEPPLLDQITIETPKGMQPNGEPAVFVVEHLDVLLGQHVEAGDKLCELGDYRTLYIEGEAFERDLPVLRQAVDRGWRVTATLERRGQQPVEIKDLPIRYIAPHVDVDSRTIKFYVELPNKLRTAEGGEGESSNTVAAGDWTFRPGQRMELQLPLQKLDDSLVVPIDAVARDGLDSYVFQVSGTTFVRRPVTVRYQDEEWAVLEDNGIVTSGVRIATSGAYQLQLALKNRNAGPAAAHHGHAH